MSEEAGSRVAADRQLIEDARARGTLSTLGAYVQLSGPGWLQSAITLGGGSLSSSLYLGVLAGFSLLWLQPFAMILGIVMLSAIGYVTLSTGERPFRAINLHVNPVLGWGWAIASLAANVIWVLPQYALAFSVLEQNLAPDLFDENGLFGENGRLGETWGKVVASVAILVLTTAITWSYDSGRRGVRIYEIVLKVLVGLIVLSFFGVFVTLLLADEGGFSLGEVLAGFVPDFGALFRPAATYTPFLASIEESYRGFWTDRILTEQRDVLISAAATAVGINMTFLFPYSLLKRGWTKEFRGLAVFDLGTGMFIPFVLATSCVVVASAARFHTQPSPALLGGDKADASYGEYVGLLEARLAQELGAEAFGALSAEEKSRRTAALPEADRRIAATLVRRDATALAQSLAPLVGNTVAHAIFGFGVLAMALSTITILMLISGFVICELLNVPQSGWPHRLGCLAAATGVFWPVVWGGGAKFWLAISASILGFTLLPIAYITFFLLMNQRALLGESLPRGGRRVLWNVLMFVAVSVATVGSVYMLWTKGGAWGVSIAGAFLALVLVGFVVRRGR